MNQEKIGKFISKCRKETKLTQQELAEQLGVTDRAISNWENGKNMPDLSLFKPLCNIFGITINDLMSGEKVSVNEYQVKLEENIVNAINDTNKKMEKQKKLLSFLLISFGILISFIAMTIFPSESSWGSHYATFGIILSVVGLNIFTGGIKWYKKIVINVGYIILSFIILFIIDYIGVVNIHQAPRFSLVKVTGDKIVYYDTPFYDIVRCHVNEDNEQYKVIKNQKYNRDNIDTYCK